MVELDLSGLKARALRGYELARLRRALLLSVPAQLVALLAVVVSGRAWPTWMLGVALTSAAVFTFWLGHGFDAALFPGVAAGGAPLALSLCASRLGGACLGDACGAVCLAACALGGAVAGITVGAWALARRPGPGVVLVTAGFSALTGALGSACVGLRGVALMLASLALALGVQQLRRRPEPG